MILILFFGNTFSQMIDYLCLEIFSRLYIFFDMNYYSIDYKENENLLKFFSII